MGALRGAGSMESIDMAARRDSALCHRTEFEQPMNEMPSVIAAVEGDPSSAALLLPEEMC